MEKENSYRIEGMVFFKLAFGESFRETSERSVSIRSHKAERKGIRFADI